MLGDGKKIYLACGATDLRKSIDALSVLACESFNLNPYGDTIFVFCNRTRDIVKILEWDGDGFWLHMKRVEKSRFHWPEKGEEEVMDIARYELEVLIASTRLRSKLKRREIFAPRTRGIKA
jgi:transposase